MNLRTYTIFTSLSLLLLGIMSCSEDVDTPDDMLTWLNESERGLVHERTGAGIRWNVKYLPHDYLAARYLQSVEHPTEAIRDSALESYKNTICFLLTVAPEAEGEGDVMYRGVGTFEEFESRAMALNFEVKDLMRLTYGGVETPAVISTMENTYGLNNRRDIMVIFAKDESAWSKADTIDCLLDDRIFNSGIHHFVYRKEDIDKIPVLIPEVD
ncbi:MAG: hypothetical protein AB7H80_09400 [Candidatus Kapaibacterium sp.]